MNLARRSRNLALWLVIAGIISSCNSEGEGFSFTQPSTDSETGTGGVGYAAVDILSYDPTDADVTVKNTATRTFSVVASGTAPLAYEWTIDNVVAADQVNSAYIFNAVGRAAGTYVLKANVSNTIGGASQLWRVKVNYKPTITAASPTQTTYYMNPDQTLSFSVTATDPNSDTLTYAWFLNGLETGETGSTYNFTPTVTELGLHSIQVKIYDGDSNDPGTWSETRTWSVNVNRFTSGCNTMENSGSTNRTCVIAGVPNVGSGFSPLTDPEKFRINPRYIKFRSNGSFFLTDANNHTIWYYNNSASATTFAGVNIAAYSMKIIVGFGYASSTFREGDLATRQGISSPYGMEYDEATSTLYIGDRDNHRIKKITSTGAMTTLYANSAVCNLPAQVVLNGGLLWVSCVGNHRIVTIDPSNPVTATVVAGNGGTTVDATTMNNGIAATAATLNTPYHFEFGPDGSLYIAEFIGCRIRVMNTRASGNLSYLNGSFTLSPGQMGTLVGDTAANTCASTEAAVANVGGRVNNPHSLMLDGSLLYISEWNGHRHSVVNLSGTDVVRTPRTLTAYGLRRHLGNGGTGFSDGLEGSTAVIQNPSMIAKNPLDGHYYSLEGGYQRIRKILSTNWYIYNWAGYFNFARRGKMSDFQEYSDEDLFSEPLHLLYDSVNKKIMVSDRANHRIRSISNYGVNKNELGTGFTGGADSEDVSPTTATINEIRQAVIYKKTATFAGHIIYTDYNNSVVRLWNRGTTSLTAFGVTILAGKVRTIAGVNGVLGTGSPGAGTTVALRNPSGVATDDTNLWIADRGNHCIRKLDASGNITDVSGVCGTGNAGSTDGALGANRLNAPMGLNYWTNGTTSGVFIADSGNNRIRFLRTAGSGAFLGSNISVGNTNRVACGGTLHDDDIFAVLAACSDVLDVQASGNRFCFSNGNYSNVRCVNISTTNIKTVFGSIQGSGTTETWFRNTAYTSADQSDIIATQDPSNLSAPFGNAGYPRGLAFIDDNTLVLVEQYGSGTVRKIKLTP